MTPIGISKIDLEQGWYSEQFNSKEENMHLIFQRDVGKEVFGYLIDFSSNENKIIETEKGIKLIGEKELNINYQELGDKL